MKIITVGVCTLLLSFACTPQNRPVIAIQRGISLYTNRTHQPVYETAYSTTLLLLASLVACKQEKHTLSNDATSPSKDSLRTELMNVDRNYSKESQRIGFYRATLNHVADNGIIFSNGSMPVIGKQALSASFATRSDSSYTLSWEPLYGNVASSGDMGYTFGGWTMFLKKANKDTTLFGNYVTVWERQFDGTWKFVVDGVGDTPEPLEMQPPVTLRL